MPVEPGYALPLRRVAQRAVERNGGTYLAASLELDMPTSTLHDLCLAARRMPLPETFRKITAGADVDRVALLVEMGYLEVEDLDDGALAVRIGGGVAR